MMEKSPETVRRQEFFEIVRRFEAELLRHAKRCTNGDLNDAEDLVQESVIRAYKAYLDGLFQAGSNARAWLLRIVTNQFLNDKRRIAKWCADLDVDTAIESGQTKPSGWMSEPKEADARIMETVLDGPLELALQSLPAGQRMCVQLVDVEGFDYIEAAEMLELPIGTVKSRLARARLQLYTLLAPIAKSKGWVR